MDRFASRGVGDRRLDNAISHGHAQAGAHRAAYEQHAIVTGLLLIERKQRLGHGRWLPWLAEHFAGSQTTAKDYMSTAREWAANRRSTGDVDAADEAPEPPADEPESTHITDEELAAADTSADAPIRRSDWIVPGFRRVQRV